MHCLSVHLHTREGSGEKDDTVTRKLCSFLACHFIISYRTSDCSCGRTCMDIGTVNVSVFPFIRVKMDGEVPFFFFFFAITAVIEHEIHVRSIWDTNKIFERYWAGCFSNHRAKHPDVISCLWGAKHGFKNKRQEKHCTVFKMKCAVRKKYAEFLGENGTTADFLSLLGKFFWLHSKLQGDHCLEGSFAEWFSLRSNISCLQSHFIPSSWRQARSRLQTASRQSLLIMCLLKLIYFQMLLACTVIFKKHWNYCHLRATS